MVETYVVPLLKILVLLNAVLVAVTYMVLLERKVIAWVQVRLGPMRVGPYGVLQPIADAVKLLFKEDLVPAEADSLLFRAAPYFVFTGFALIFVALPFGESLIASDLNVGIFYIVAVTALVVVGILLAGWSSNSKWALFGGMRSAAQVVSYEIPAGLAVMIPVLMAGTLSMQGIIRAQGAWPWEWFVFMNPFALVAFVIFFIAQLAEHGEIMVADQANGAPLSDQVSAGIRIPPVADHVSQAPDLLDAGLVDGLEDGLERRQV